MAGLRRAALTLSAVAAGTFLAGAAINLRLQLRVPDGLDWTHAAGQGLEVAAWFTWFAFPAVLAARGLAALWPPLAARRLAVAMVAYAVALAMFVLAFAAVDPRIGLDGIANLYLAAGSLAGTLVEAPARSRPATTAAVVA
jgi:hypothetical protein